MSRMIKISSGDDTNDIIIELTMDGSSASPPTSTGSVTGPTDAVTGGARAKRRRRRPLPRLVMMPLDSAVATGASPSTNPDAEFTSRPRKGKLRFRFGLRILFAVGVLILLYQIGAWLDLSPLLAIGLIIAAVLGILAIVAVTLWLTLSSTAHRENYHHLARRLVAAAATVAFVTGFALVGAHTSAGDVGKFYNLAAQLVVTVFPVSLALVFAVSQLNARYSISMSDVLSDGYVLLYCLIALIGLFCSTLGIGESCALARGAVYACIGLALSSLPLLVVRLRSLSAPSLRLRKLRDAAMKDGDDSAHLPISRIRSIMLAALTHHEYETAVDAARALLDLAKIPRDIDNPHSVLVVHMLTEDAAMELTDRRAFGIYVNTLALIAQDSPHIMTCRIHAIDGLATVASTALARGHEEETCLIVRITAAVARGLDKSSDLYAYSVVNAAVRLIGDLAFAAITHRSGRVLRDCVVAAVDIVCTVPSKSSVERLTALLGAALSASDGKMIEDPGFGRPHTYHRQPPGLDRYDRIREVYAHAMTAFRSADLEGPGAAVLAAHDIRSLVVTLVSYLKEVANRDSWPEEWRRSLTLLAPLLTAPKVHRQAQRWGQDLIAQIRSWLTKAGTPRVGR